MFPVPNMLTQRFLALIFGSYFNLFVFSSGNVSYILLVALLINFQVGNVLPGQFTLLVTGSLNCLLYKNDLNS